MSTDIDWQRELDASFGSRDDLPAGHYVLAGRRAVRRRRRSGLVAAVAAAAVVAGVAWGVAPGRGPARSEAPVASDPSGTATGPALFPWRKGEAPVRLGGTGVEIREGAVVHERRDGLYPGKETESVALDLSYGGDRWWVTAEWEGGGGTMSSERPEDGLHESFDAFVASAKAGGGMIHQPTSQAGTEDGRYYGGLVMWSGGDPQPRPGVEVVRTVEDPMTSAQDSLGLVLAEHGTTTWMLITSAGHDSSSASWSKESDSGWRTFDQWLDDQVALQGGETGVRLVALAEDGTVAPAQPGVDVLEQQADPDLPAYGTAAEGTDSAVALAEWQGQRWFVVVIRTNGVDSVTTVAVDKADGATSLDEFVAFMADRADEGGMR